MGAPHNRPAPADFAEHAHQPLRALEQRYRVSRPTLHRWFRESEIVRKPHAGGNEPRPVPDDFAEYQAGRSTYHLAEHYGTSRQTISEWLRKAGITRPARGRGPAAGRPKAPVAPAFARPKYGGIDRHHADMSRPARAAEYLRRYGEVIRCTAEGKYHRKGDHWRRGNGVPLTGEQIIERAIDNGWRDPFAHLDAPTSTSFTTEGDVNDRP